MSDAPARRKAGIDRALPCRKIGRLGSQPPGDCRSEERCTGGDGPDPGDELLLRRVREQRLGCPRERSRDALEELLELGVPGCRVGLSD